jgi:hypothetical protein
MSNDPYGGISGPFLDSVQINKYPPHITWNPEEVFKSIILADGSEKRYSMGFKISFVLSWSKGSLMSEQQMETLRKIFNKRTELRFQPYPDNYPTSVFYVRWSGSSKFEPPANRPYDIGWEGDITLEEINIRSQLPQWI